MNDYNASSTRDIRRAQRAQRQAEAERQTVIFNLMSSSSGRAFVYDWLVRTYTFRTPFTPSAQLTAFACGEQNVGFQLLGDITRFAPDQYIQMMREANDRELANGRRNSGGNNGSGRDQSNSGWADSAGPGNVESEYDPDPDDGEAIASQ